MGPPHDEVFGGASGLVRCSSLDVQLMHLFQLAVVPHVFQTHRLYQRSGKRKETLMHDRTQNIGTSPL